MRSALLCLGVLASACASEPLAPTAPNVASAPPPIPVQIPAPVTPPTAAAPAPAPAPADVKLSTMVLPISEGRAPVDVTRVDAARRALDPAVRACGSGPSTSGKLWLVARIDTAGAVSAVELGDTDLPEPFFRCVQAALEALRLDAQATPLAVSFFARVAPPSPPGSVTGSATPARASTGALAEEGTDQDHNAFGNMWGDSIGEAYGAGGLGLSGIGPGGGGRGEGIGLGSIGTIGHGAGTGTGQGFGRGSGRLGGAHHPKPPKIKLGATSVSGRLPPEVIRRIVRQNFGRFRLCYENGLRTKPTLEGRVTVSFTIERDGAVSSVASDRSTTLPDAKAVACVTRAFLGLSFPQPEAGIVRVVYPILFSPGVELVKGATSAPKAKPIRVGGKPLAALTSADLVAAIGASGDRTAALGPKPRAVAVTRDDAKDAPFVVFAETASSEVAAILRVEAPAAQEAPPAAADPFTIVERIDTVAKPHALRVVSPRSEIGDDLLDVLVEH